MAKVSDIPAIEQKLREAKADGPAFNAVYSELIGPVTGLQYDEDTGKVTVAKDQYAVIKETGEIVRRADYIGPGIVEWKMEGEDYIVRR